MSFPDLLHTLSPKSKIQWIQIRTVSRPGWNPINVGESGYDQNKHSGGCVKAGNLKKKMTKNGYYASCAWVMVVIDMNYQNVNISGEDKRIF